jgi:hypothetical protein
LKITNSFRFPRRPSFHFDDDAAVDAGRFKRGYNANLCNQVTSEYFSNFEAIAIGQSGPPRSFLDFGNILK